MLKKCVLENGLIVAKEFDEHLMRETNRTFVPYVFLPSILTVMHVRLDHPLPSQLLRMFQKYFVAFNLLKECQFLSEVCSFCISLARFPKELDVYDPQLVPQHPGTHMNMDVMRRAGQYIMVNCDLFSGYTTATLIDSEQRQDMVRGILDLTTPIRHCSRVVLRVDKAPALKSLATNLDQELVSNGISLELGEDLNKNSNCSIDKTIQELEAELRKLCPKETKLNSGTLCRAVINLNDKIRQQNLSSSQIHFSRDTNLGENLHLDDRKLIEEKVEKKTERNKSSALSKAPRGKIHETPNIQPGQIVYARDDGSKHNARDPLLVTAVDGKKVKVQKILHSHPTAAKSPKITSQEITADEKFLYVPPHRRSNPPQRQGSSDDTWWRGTRPTTRTSSTTTATPTKWTPTQRYDYNDDDDDEITLQMNSVPNDDTGANNDVTDNVLIENAVNSDDEREQGNDQAGVLDGDETEIEEEDDQARVLEGDETEIDEAEHGENDDQADDEYSADNSEGDNDQDLAAVGDQDPAPRRQADNNQDLGAVGGQDPAPRMPNNQSKKPVRGDTIAFVKGDSWTYAKIKNRVAGYVNYYNIVYEDGTEDGLYLNPPSVDKEESWTFIDNSFWRPSGLAEENIEMERVEQYNMANTPDSLSSMVVDQVHSNNASMDWDNYASEPTYVTNTTNSFDSPIFNIDELDISSVSDISDETVPPPIPPPPPPPLCPRPMPSEPPPLPPRARPGALSVIMCSAATCKPKYPPL